MESGCVFGRGRVRCLGVIYRSLGNSPNFELFKGHEKITAIFYAGIFRLAKARKMSMTIYLRLFVTQDRRKRTSKVNSLFF